MIVVFDLDDTLYPEQTYVASGFAAVAAHLAERFGIDPASAEAAMWESLRAEGRGRQFNAVIARFGLARRQSVAELVRVYRHHRPAISLPESSARVLAALAPRPLYIVTDGHKGVQQRKLQALGLAPPQIRHAYITHRYGVAAAKPSTRVFQLLIRRERCAPADVVYIGDDPSKDFRGIRPLGLRTVRVRTGRHAGVEVQPEHDAEISVAGVGDALAVITRWEAAPGQAASPVPAGGAQSR